MPRLLEKYKKSVIPALQKEFDISNVMAVPKILKVTVNSGIGRILKEGKMIEKLKNDMAVLTGQKPSSRKAKRSIASFKIREGQVVGYSVTIRGKRMYDFLDRLIAIALPMSKDFRGIDLKNIDKHGNLNLGIREHNIFPEVTYESTKDIFGMQITVTTNAKSQEKGISLLRHLGFPLKKNNG